MQNGALSIFGTLYGSFFSHWLIMTHFGYFCEYLNEDNCFRYQ